MVEKAKLPSMKLSKRISYKEFKDEFHMNQKYAQAITVIKFSKELIWFFYRFKKLEQNLLLFSTLDFISATFWTKSETLKIFSFNLNFSDSSFQGTRFTYDSISDLNTCLWRPRLTSSDLPFLRYVAL